MDVKSFWKDVLSQNQTALQKYFHTDAIIRWHCTNEVFTASEYIRVNCEYPGDWDGEIERVEEAENTIIMVVRVFPLDRSLSCHVVCFIKLETGVIIEMDEYWADDGLPPSWRKEMKIGKSIR